MEPLQPVGTEREVAIEAIRAIDAVANRAREALRVLEDVARFLLDDRFLTGQLKSLRHDLATTLSEVSLGDRLAARETETDVGTSLTAESEQVRLHMDVIVTANFMRLEESLRSLEEFGKLPGLAFGSAMKQLRYRSYTIHKSFTIISLSVEMLERARLYVLLDGRGSADELVSLARALIAAGVDVLQLRDKHLDDRTLLDRARRLRDVTAGTETLFIVNDRPDLARLSGADGVHLGQEELTVKDARRIVGPRAIVGVSTHSIDQARQAVLDGATYIGVGPTFESQTKAFQYFTGIELLAAVSAETRLPAFAVGGIGEENLDQVLATGIGRAAVSGAVLHASDPAAAAERLARRLKSQVAT